MRRSIASSGDPKGVQGGERKATLLASMGGNFAVRNSPLVGIDAPTPAREEGLQSLWDARLLRVAIRRGLGANGKPPVRP